MVAELTAALDHKPSAFERALIQQLAAVLWLRPTLDTARVTSRIIGQLGLPDPEPVSPDFTTRLAAVRARAADSEAAE